MNSEKFKAAYDGMGDAEAAMYRVWARLGPEAAVSGEAVEQNETRPVPIGKLRRTWPVAAAISTLLIAAVYAIGFFGVYAQLRTDRIDRADPHENIAAFTQPPVATENVDPELAQKGANVRTAWAEWAAYRQAERKERLGPRPELFDLTEGYGVTIGSTLEDGRVIVWLIRDGKIVDTLTASQEEIDTYNAYRTEEIRDELYWWLYVNDHPVPPLDEMKEKLIEIAEKYGLTLYEKSSGLWNAPVIYVDDGAPVDEVIENLAEINSGNIFSHEPTFFSAEVRHHGEGSFYLEFDMPVPNTGHTIRCRAYNGIYTTLSDGGGIDVYGEAVQSLPLENYVTADGTEVLIRSDVQGGSIQSAYIYVYLEKSFFAQQLTCKEGLTEADIHYVADSIRYKLINQ